MDLILLGRMLDTVIDVLHFVLKQIRHFLIGQNHGYLDKLVLLEFGYYNE